MLKNSFYIILILLLNLFVAVAEEAVDDPGTAFYPDLVLTDNIFVGGDKVIPDEPVVVRSLSALDKQEGRCAIGLEYEIYNRGAVPVGQRFFSTIEINGKEGSSRLINGIGADEKITVRNVVWMVPGEELFMKITADNLNNVKEVSEEGNVKELSVLLAGKCDEEEEVTTDQKKSGVDGLFEKFDYRPQDHELYSK